MLVKPRAFAFSPHGLWAVGLSKTQLASDTASSGRPSSSSCPASAGCSRPHRRNGTDASRSSRAYATSGTATAATTSSASRSTASTSCARRGRATATSAKATKRFRSTSGVLGPVPADGACLGTTTDRSPSTFRPYAAATTGYALATLEAATADAS